MSARPSSKRFVGAGAAGVAAVLAVAPFAHADPARPHAAAAPSSAVPPAGDGSGQSAAKRPQAPDAVAPDFGFQKIRVGVQIKDGSWVPPGTNTGGTEVSIAETGPDAETPTSFEGTSCTTEVGSEDPGSTETYCFIGGAPQAAQHLRNAIARAGLIAPAASPANSQNYLAFPGDTVTFTQTTVNDGLVIDSVPKTVGPCVNTQPEGGSQYPDCPGGDQFNDVVFNDPGLPPTARNDSATVVSGHSVIIKILANDVTNGAPAEIIDVTNAKHGKVVGDATPTIEYDSRAPYVGHDSFRYTLSTPNGKSTATVDITVTAPPPTAVNDSAETVSGQPVAIDVLDNDDANGGGELSVQSVGTPGHGTARISDGKVVYTPDASFTGTDTFTYTAATTFGTDAATVTVTVGAPSGLAATGSSSYRLANIGVLLLVTGGAATVVGRRRYRAKHAGSH